MWTEITRAQYRRDDLPFASELLFCGTAGRNHHCQQDQATRSRSSCLHHDIPLIPPGTF